MSYDALRDLDTGHLRQMEAHLLLVHYLVSSSVRKNEVPHLYDNRKIEIESPRYYINIHDISIANDLEFGLNIRK